MIKVKEKEQKETAELVTIEPTPAVEPIKEVEKLADNLDKAELKTNRPRVKDFMEIEQVRDMDKYPLTVYNFPPKYVARWCYKGKMSVGRRGIWLTVDKRHPDFEEVKVEIDDSPEASYFSFGDLVLCCARRETVDSRRIAHAEKISKRTKRFEAGVSETLARVGREAHGLSKKTEQMLDSDFKGD